MTEKKKLKLDEKDFLFDIEGTASQHALEGSKDLKQKIEKLSSSFAESSERKKLLRL